MPILCDKALENQAYVHIHSHYCRYLLIEVFGNYSNEKCHRNFPVIMPYLRHIVEQPIERFYCSLLISLKVRIRMIYVIDSFV